MKNKASFDPRFQEEKSINEFSSMDQMEKTPKSSRKRIEDGYEDTIRVGYRQGSAIPAGPSNIPKLQGQMNKSKDS